MQRQMIKLERLISEYQFVLLALCILVHIQCNISVESNRQNSSSAFRWVEANDEPRIVGRGTISKEGFNTFATAYTVVYPATLGFQPYIRNVPVFPSYPYYLYVTAAYALHIHTRSTNHRSRFAPIFHLTSQ